MTTDEERARSQELAFALMNGYGCLEAIIEGDVSAEVVAGLDALEPALIEFITLRDAGRTIGGPHGVTVEDIARLRRLRALVRQSPHDADEIERLARSLLISVGGTAPQ